jgi:iron(III) transport system substrate-binding protein
MRSAKSSRGPAALGIALLLSMVLAACGGAANTSDAESEAPEPVEVSATTVEELYEAAKAERQIVWHIGFAAEEAAALEEAFEARYPEVELLILSAETDDIPARLIAESQANQVSIDVGTGRTDTIEPLVERDLIEVIDWASFDESIADDKILFDGRMVRLYDFINGWVYNADLVAEEDVPQDWDELLDSKWNSKVIGDAAGDLGLGALVNSGEWSQEQAAEFIQGFVELDPALANSGRVAAPAVGSGQYELGAVPLTVVPAMIDEGANVGIVPVGPLSAVPTAAFVPKGAPHPNAARLLAIWLGGEEATAIWQELGRGLTDTCEGSTLGQMLCDAGVEARPLADFDEARVEAELASQATQLFTGEGIQPIDPE